MLSARNGSALIEPAVVIAIIAILLHSAVPASAQELTPEQVAELSLQELAQVVAVASKREESVFDAPGIVSIITKEEIRQFGAGTLYELLNRMPSIYAIGTYGIPQNLLSIRGDNFAHYNARVLLLIDGRPFRETTLGGSDAPFLLGFPVDLIERIELVRGPGSVLYGTNAYNGMINVITRKVDANTKTKLSLGGGSFGGRSLNLSGGRVGDDFSIFGGLHAFEEDGWRFEATDEGAVHTSTPYGEENLGGLVRLQYKNLTLNTFFAHLVEDQLGVVPFFPTSEREQSRYFADLGYSMEFSEEWSLELHTTYNRLDYKVPFQVLPAEPILDIGAESLLFEVTTTFQPTDDLNFVFGIEADHHNGFIGSPAITISVPEFNEWWYRAYLQADYRPVPHLKLIAGIQWNKVESLDSGSVPRLGAIIDFTHHWGLKLLYGEAYRAPFPLERFVVGGAVLNGNPDLKPETIETFEAQLFYHSNKLTTSLTIFNSRQKNLITRVNNPAPTFANLDEAEFEGIEFELKNPVSKRLYFTGSATYQRNENQNGVENFTLMPNFMAKYGISYESLRGMSFSIFDTYIGNGKDNNRLNPARLEVNPDADAYHLLSANMIFYIDRLRGREGKTNTTLRIYATNLLDEDINLPEFSRRNINTLPHAGGRAFFAEVSIEF